MSVLRTITSYLFGLSKTQQGLLNILEKSLGKKQRQQIEKQLRAGEIQLLKEQLHIADNIYTYPQIRPETEANKKLKADAYKQSFSEFSHTALDEIAKSIAPNILGLEYIKRAAALQLFTTEKMHVLLLGDPGTGKTDILTSSKELAPISSMGLGSGTTGAGLSVTYNKQGVQKGLLPMANNGICCIDELNLMKKDDRAALYNAMEKGFITYDKAGKHEKYEANVRVLATANPKGDKFEGEDVNELKKQLPFDAALLSRFHIVFLIRKPDKKQFLEITRKIVSNQKKAEIDTEYITEYIKHTQQQNITFPKHLEVLVSEAAEKLKDAEDTLLIEVSPRIIKGIIGFAKASARMHQRKKVRADDIRNVLEILSESTGVDL